MKENTTIAVDLAKSVFEVAVSTEPGRVSERKRLSRAGLKAYLLKREPATVVMEACGSAHQWGRELEAMGHGVRLLPPHKTGKYRIGNKTDRTDADALLEANRNENIKPVPVKTVQQQALSSVHRMRAGWMRARTARLNGLRGLLRELGITIAVGARQVLPRVSEAVGKGEIPKSLHPLMLAAMREVRQLEQNIDKCDDVLKAMAKSIPVAAVLEEVPGIGPLGATALIAAVGDVHRFRSGRKMASFFGVVPREHSSGMRRALGSITKRGDPYARTVLIHGGRSVLVAAHRSKVPDRLKRWALEVERRQGRNRAAVAVANKLIRIAWALWKRGTHYDREPLVVLPTPTKRCADRTAESTRSF
jgi:transposase